MPLFHKGSAPAAKEFENKSLTRLLNKLNKAHIMNGKTEKPMGNRIYWYSALMAMAVSLMMAGRYQMYAFGLEQ